MTRGGVAHVEGRLGTLGLGAGDQSLPYTVRVLDRLPTAERTFQTPPPCLAVPAQAALQPTRRLPGQEGWGHPG